LPAAAAAAGEDAPIDGAPVGYSATQPVVDPSLAPVFLPIVFAEREAVRYLTSEAGGQIAVKSINLLYDPAVLGAATVRFGDPKRRVDAKLEVMRLARADDSATGVDWAKAEDVPVESRRLAKSPELAEQGPYFAPVPAGAASSKKLAAASKELADWLYYNQALKISVQPELNIARDPDEDERQFRIRIQQAARERRDAEVEALTKKYGKQIDALADKVQRAQQNLNEAQAKAQAKQAEQWVNIGESVLGFFTGKSTRRAVSSATSKWNQANAAAANVEETRQSIAQLEAEKQQLEAELSAQVQEITAAWERAESNLVSDELKPKRSDVDIQTVTLGWAPAWQITYAAGDRERTDTLAAYQLPEVG
jgi:hypothetical protein